ncbi:MAG: ammonium transporter, Amt family [Candidatus Peregrinibacteria bacterium Greene1014_49]|nr:MAG: ammonium transporter, Amt family [Candidatus Peregrinibacteria bacterium Greene1014_49]
MEPTLLDMKVALDTVWVLMTAFLVFFMNAGFALVESGFSRAKNCVNILAKNYVVFAVSSIAFWMIGFGLMFGNGTSLFGQTGFFPSLINGSSSFSALDWTIVPMAAKFFFQLVFAGTAATIVSGAVAERIKFPAFILFSVIMTAFLYPIAGHWIWGGGFLSTLGFHDFAGSTVVHSIGGWAALTGALILGPRIGRFSALGKSNPIRGHNMTSATLGGLILWLGWFGFNPGSTMAADGRAIAHIALTGLVAITAGCDAVSMWGALAIGAISGVLVVLASFAFERLRVDDPVGALPVHLVNGVWGTLAYGLFATSAGSLSTVDGLLYGGGFGLLKTQVLGVAAVGGFVLVASALAWGLIRMTVGMRVSATEELAGLDAGEHGMTAYEFEETSIFMTGSSEKHLGSIPMKKIVHEPMMARG